MAQTEISVFHTLCACCSVQDLAELAVEQMQGVIHTLIRKGTTAALRLKVSSCVSYVLDGTVKHDRPVSYAISEGDVCVPNGEFLVRLEVLLLQGNILDKDQPHAHVMRRLSPAFRVKATLTQ